MTDEKTYFLIPVRGGSRRIPRKNMLELDGETLLARKIRQCSYLGTVIVGSDDDEMLKEAERCGAMTVRRGQCSKQPSPMWVTLAGMRASSRASQ